LNITGTEHRTGTLRKRLARALSEVLFFRAHHLALVAAFRREPIVVQCIQFLLSTLSTREDEGQGMVEYGLIVALIAVVVAVALGTMGENISALFDGISFS
jgi:pilus assembly protein Flp/PilA